MRAGMQAGGARAASLARVLVPLLGAIVLGLGPLAVPAGATAAWSGCPGLQAPPPPAAKEEAGPVPAPLPWPAEPVGGPGMGTCATVGPAAPAGIDAVSYVVADLDSGAVLAARAPHARERPASTLKVLLSLVALGTLNPDTVVEGTAADLTVDGSKAGIGPGGQYTVRTLMIGLLLNSGNDTAQALARAMGGTAPTIAAMTAYAQAHGALDTRPATVSGLDGPGMSASAYDLATLFRQALRDPLFASTLKVRTAPFPGYGDKPGFLISSTEQFAPRYPDAIGSKSGFTDAARHTLIAAREHDGRRLVVVLMRGEQHPVPMWKQAAALLDQAFAQPEAPVGTLVDTTPPAPGAAAPQQVAAAPPGPQPSGLDPVVLGTGTGAVVLALGTAMIILRRRKRP